MDLDEIKRVVASKLSEQRYAHTLRVADEAVSLANRYNECPKQAKIAALLHDIAKDMSKEALKDALRRYELPTELFQFHHELWHGPVGAKMATTLFRIEDKAIYNAIYYHTTGRAQMSKLELIIFLADYIEPYRDFPGLSSVRRLAKQELYKATHQAIQNTIIYLMKNKQTIHPDSFYAYNDLTKMIRSDTYIDE